MNPRANSRAVLGRYLYSIYLTHTLEKDQNQTIERVLYNYPTQKKLVCAPLSKCMM